MAKGKVHIIGAGLSGLSAAVRLTQSGHKVTLWELARFAGGRCRSLYEPALDMVIDNGNHLLLSGNHAALDFLKVMRIPVITSPNGKGTLDETSDLSFGPMGRNGPYAANEATRNADVLLALGCSFDDRATSAWISGYTLAIPPTKLIQIDNDPS